MNKGVLSKCFYSMQFIEMSMAPAQYDRVRELEQIFIERRDTVIGVLSDSKKRLLPERCSIKQLEDELCLYNHLTLEASKLDDEYRAITKRNQSDPNYDQLIAMYNGVKNLLRREIRERRKYSGV